MYITSRIKAQRSPHVLGPIWRRCLFGCFLDSRVMTSSSMVIDIADASRLTVIMVSLPGLVRSLIYAHLPFPPGHSQRSVPTLTVIVRLPSSVAVSSTLHSQLASLARSPRYPRQLSRSIYSRPVPQQAQPILHRRNRRCVAAQQKPHSSAAVYSRIAPVADERSRFTRYVAPDRYQDDQHDGRLVRCGGSINPGAIARNPRGFPGSRPRQRRIGGQGGCGGCAG